ncbi:hypothetical protein AVEN_214267-1 [Araneus ventricosus]|uniref:Laminin subunit alpha-2 n=1 Tax=Araneus ventricosus TaxID=182803 RepID=A0A4Y2UIH7_ARAVE|nr:hypothetical protein AVEN_168072-1 [Araneus ventricosus]GBO11931.1 hypothetical protein AVEN_214267-1 [Araneus ventricosus]
MKGLPFMSPTTRSEEKRRSRVEESISQINYEQLGPVMDRLKESFERIVNKMKERFDGGGGIDGGLMKKAQDLFEKLKSKKFPLSDKIKSIFEDLKSKMGRSSVQSGPMTDRLKEAFENLVNKIKERVDGGSGVSSDLMKRAEDIYEKLKNLKVEISEKIRNIFEDLRSKFGKNSVQQGPIIDKLKEAFERIVSRIKERFDGGSGVSGGLMGRAENIYEILKNLRVEISEKIRSIFEDMRSKMGRNSVQSGPMTDRMKEAFENIVNRIKEAFDSGKGVRGDLMKKAEDIYEKLKNLKVEISDKIKSIFEDLRSKMGRNSVQSGPMTDRMKEAFENIVNRIKEAFDSGKGVREDLMKKAEDIYEKLKNLKVEISDKIKSIFEDLRSKMGRNSVQSGPMGDRLKEAFENIVNRIKEAFDSGKGVRGDLMKKVKTSTIRCFATV